MTCKHIVSLNGQVLLALFALAADPAASAAAQAAAAPPADTAAAPGGNGAPGAGKAQAAWQKYCDPDVQRVCKEVAAKGGLVTECLAKNEETLSEDCKRQFLWKWKVSQLCKEDMDRLCKDVVKSGGSLGKCFQEKEKDLSEKCRAALVRGSRQAKAEDRAEARAEAAAAKSDEAPAKPRRKRGAAAAKKAE